MVTGIDYRLTLRIEGVRLTSEDEARETFRRVGNSALFEIDRISELGLYIPRYPERGERHKHPVEAESSRANLEPPALDREYSAAPLLLYWHARSTPEMPLVQFLGYYQVLEYYFSTYSRSKTIKALREKLRAIYGVARETDVAGILQALRANRRAIFGGERDQLRHTIEQCVSEEELQGFLNDEERTRFYNDTKSQDISTVRLAVDSAPADRRNDASRRIYEIRNRIVHTKSEHDDLDPLLPLDPEVELLRHDIELVQFLARKVLIASAKPL